MDVLELEKKLEESKLVLKKEKAKNVENKFAEQKLKYEYDRELVRSLMGTKNLEVTEEALDPKDYLIFEVKGSKFATKRENFEGIKKGYFTIENLQKKESEGIIKIDDIEPDQFNIILSHIRSKFKLTNIGIPDELEERMKLLGVLIRYDGLDKLRKRIEILCFVQSLDQDDDHQKKIKIVQEMELIKKQVSYLHQMNEKQELHNKELKVKIEQEKSNVKIEKVEDESVSINVGGGDFTFLLNDEFEKLKGTKLYELVMSKKGSPNKTVFIDRSKKIFKKIHQYLFNKGEFVRSVDLSLDEEKHFIEEMVFYLSKDDDLHFPIDTIGEKNLKIKLEEDFVREMFVVDRENKLLENNDLLLISIFDRIREFKRLETPLIPENLPLMFDIENEYPKFLPKFREVFLPPLVKNLQEFKKNFSLFATGLLEGLDFKNIFVAGGAVVGNIMDYSVKGKPREEKKKKKKQFGRFGRFGRRKRFPFKFGGATEKQEKHPKKEESSYDKFRRKERLLNFNESNLDSFDNSRYLSLLKVPVSPLLLKRLITLQADLTAASGFKRNSNAKYNEYEVPASMQFFQKLMFHQNEFILRSPRLEKEIEFKFAVGTENLPNQFAKLPQDYFPIGISKDLDYLLFTTLGTKFKQDFPVFFLHKDGNMWDAMPISTFITLLRKNDEVPIDQSTFSMRNKYFGKSDVDMFLYDISVEDARKKVREIYECIKGNLMKQEGTIQDILIIRTAYSITFQFHKRRPIQIVLRIYKTPLEVIAGFDIDSCCIGYTGEKVVCLPRWKKSYLQRYNLVNVERQSTTYEHRLCKYAQRGFRVAIPGYDVKKVRREGLLEVGDEKAVGKNSKNVYTDPIFLNTVGLARLIVLESKMKKVMKYPLYVVERSDYDAEFLMIPARLRRANPNFVSRLLNEKLDVMGKKMEKLNLYAGTKSGKWKVPMIYSLNDVEKIMIVNDPNIKLPNEVEFMLKNPGTQKKITSSFRPIEVNFFEGAYLNYKELVEKRWSNNLGCYRWWYSGDEGSTLLEFSSHQNFLLEEAFQSKLNILKTRSVIVDFDSMTCFFTKDKEEEAKYKIYRLKDYTIPK